MAGSDSTMYKGFFDTPHLQDRARMYSQEEKIFQLLAIRQVNPLSILTVLSEKFGTVPASMITDWQFRYQEFDELLYRYTLDAASVQPVSGSLYDYVKVSNNFAAGLNTNHRLQSSGTYMGIDLSSGVTTSNCAATFDVTNRPLNEVIRVVGIGEPSSAYFGNAAASNYTWIKVLRAHPGASVTGQLAAIPSSSVLTIVNSVSRTNQRPNPPVTANGKYLYNVCQITRESYGVGEHMTQGGGVKTFLFQDGTAALDLNFTLNETRLMKTIERSLISGRRFMAETNGESEYETGGIAEFIPSSNYINAGGVLNIRRINNIISQALDTSGVRELYMFGGSTYTKNLAAAYENKRGFGENTELSVRYGLTVNEIMGTGRDGIVYHINAPILSELGMDNQAFILNLTEYNHGEGHPYGCFQIAEKVPMLDLPEDADSYEKNSGYRGTWRELYYAYGLIRRLQETHFRVYGVTS
jgi:hypothetical protein